MVSWFKGRKTSFRLPGANIRAALIFGSCKSSFNYGTAKEMKKKREENVFLENIEKIRSVISICDIYYSFVWSFLVQIFSLAQDYNILDFGAQADGQTLNTAVIQSAIDAAHKKGGGRVIVPAGRFLTGALQMKSGVELHVQKEGSTARQYQP
jgi:hypothetical protein